MKDLFSSELVSLTIATNFVEPFGRHSDEYVNNATYIHDCREYDFE